MGSAGRTVATPDKLAPNPESKPLAHVELGSDTEAIWFMVSRLLPSPYPTMSTRAPSAFMFAIALNAADGPPLVFCSPSVKNMSVGGWPPLPTRGGRVLINNRGRWCREDAVRAWRVAGGAAEGGRHRSGCRPGCAPTRRSRRKRCRCSHPSRCTQHSDRPCS